jgi:hypothetical protein
MPASGVVLFGLRDRESHVVDDELELRMPLRDAREIGHAAAEEHHRNSGRLRRRPEPVGRAVGEPPELRVQSRGR